MSNKNFYITTAIDYASGSPHIGHAYEKISADVLNRWKKNIGFNSFFSTGTDEHGQKIVDKAKENSLDVKEFVDRESKKFIDLCSFLNIKYDYFVRTTDENHKLFVQKMLQKSYDNGDIYLGKYEGLYCVGCEQYYVEEDLLEGEICPIHKTKCKVFNEENYFFRLSNYQEKLLSLYSNNKEFILPDNRRQEIINRVKEGLKDISISRQKSNLSWGVEFPFDNNHVTYVWFDALFNYISVLDSSKKEEFWPANLHLIGKDIMWFHMVYWPAFLMSVGFEIPKTVFAHGMILDKDGHKMSKSLANIIPYEEIVKKYGVDEFRYFLLSLGTYGEDLNFSEEQLIQKVNNELNNDLGNLVSRVHSMTERYFDGIVPMCGQLSDDENTLIAKLNFFEKFDTAMSSLKFNHALDILWESIRETNAYINRVSPWKIQEKERLGTVINVLCSSMQIFASYLDCFMPGKAHLLNEQFAFTQNKLKFKFESLPEGHKIAGKENLFSKIKVEEKKEKELVLDVKKSEFESLQLVVGKILEVEKVKESNKLYRIQVDLGFESRQILSGLQQIYELNELKDRKVVVLSNLKPAKMAGLESNGMILAVEDEEGNCGLLEPSQEVGTFLSCGQLKADNSSQIKIKEFLKVKIVSDGENISYNDKKIPGIKVDRTIKGLVC